MKLLKNVGHLFCQIFNDDVFGRFCLQNLIILFPPAKYDFNNSVSLNAFASKAATIAVIVGHCSNDLEFFIDRNFRASILSFSALRKLINAFPFFFVRLGEGASQVDYRRISHHLNPALPRIDTWIIA